MERLGLGNCVPTAQGVFSRSPWRSKLCSILLNFGDHLVTCAFNMPKLLAILFMPIHITFINKYLSQKRNHYSDSIPVYPSSVKLPNI